MPIKIYNSLTRKKEEFIPLKEGQVGMYVCGPTVYDEPHIGHLRSAYIFDVIRRYLIYRGYKVTFVRNVTDVDDKIINKAKEEYPNEKIERAAEKVSLKYLESYHKAMGEFGIMPPDKEPKATEYIKKMQKFIGLLIDKGIAYQSGGDVYFDIKKSKDYGKLSNQSLDMMEAGARIAPGENKKDPLDFALWKAAKEGEPSWPGAWGRGRPGWHIECSVMSSNILGGEFDIHGGGIDLIFPHHENEIAQSEGAGEKFAKYWMHNGLLTINGQKMAKSLGNFITIKQFVEQHKDFDYLKLLFLNTHYRHPVDYTQDKIEEMKKEKERILILLDKLPKKDGPSKAKNLKFKEIDNIIDNFEEAMDDDFNMPQGLAVIFELVNIANKQIDDPEFAFRAGEAIVKLAGIFGLGLKAAEKKLSKEESTLIKGRAEARKKGNFQEADRIRKELEEKDIILEDTKDSTTWRRKI